MNRQDATLLAIELMNKHGLHPRELGGWRFKIDETPRKRLGRCQYRGKIISITGWYIDRNGVKEVTNTILHEIAHALTPGCGHGLTWKRKAIEIGCDGKRLADTEEITMIPARYAATCPHCGRTYTRERVRRGDRYYCRCTRVLVDADPPTKFWGKVGLEDDNHVRGYPRLRFVVNPMLTESAASIAVDTGSRHGNEIAGLLHQLAHADKAEAKRIRAKLRRLGHRGGLR